MALLTDIISARDLTTLQTNVDAFFVANPTARVRAFEFLASDQIAQQGIEMAIVINYDLGGASLAAAPFTISFFTDGSAAGLNSQVSAFLALNPNDFYAGPYVQLLKERRRDSPWMAAVVTSSSPNAQSKWLTAAVGSGVSTGRANITVADSPYTIPDDVEMVFVDATGGPVIVNLPPVANAVDQWKCVKKVDVSANAVTVTPNGAETIDGAANHPLAAQYNSVMMYDDATPDWHIMATI